MSNNFQTHLNKTLIDHKTIQRYQMQNQKFKKAHLYYKLIRVLKKNLNKFQRLILNNLIVSMGIIDMMIRIRKF